MAPTTLTGAHPGPVSQFGSRFVKGGSLDGIAVANATLVANAIKTRKLMISKTPIFDEEEERL